MRLIDGEKFAATLTEEMHRLSRVGDVACSAALSYVASAVNASLIYEPQQPEPQPAPAPDTFQGKLDQLLANWDKVNLEIRGALADKEWLNPNGEDLPELWKERHSIQERIWQLKRAWKE